MISFTVLNWHQERKVHPDTSDYPDHSDRTLWRYDSTRQSTFLLLFRRRVRLANRGVPSGGSQKIPTLVLRALTPSEAVPNDQPQSEASVLNLPFLMPARAAFDDQPLWLRFASPQWSADAVPKFSLRPPVKGIRRACPLARSLISATIRRSGS